MRIVLSGAAFICCMGFAGAANSNVYAIVDAVNAKLRANEQFSHFWWGPLKLKRVHDAYHRLYPQGRLIRRERMFLALAWLSLVAAAGLFSFGFLGVAWLWEPQTGVVY